MDIVDIVRVPLALAALLFICWLMSANRALVPWRSVFVGVALQFGIAVVVLWSAPGQLVLRGISEAVTHIVQSSAAGGCSQRKGPRLSW